MGANFSSTLYVEKVFEDAILPVRMTSDSTGYDLFTPRDIEILPGEKVEIDTGIKIYLLDNSFLSKIDKIGEENNTQNCDYGITHFAKIFDKSSVASKKQCQVLGGVIDPGYTGNIIVILHNFNQKNEVAKFSKGDPIAQLVFISAILPEVKEIDDANYTTITTNKTVRGTRGFGQVTEDYFEDQSSSKRLCIEENLDCEEK